MASPLMNKPPRGVATALDTNVGRVSPASPHTYPQSASPVGSFISTPGVSPEPAYIAPKEAGYIITREVLLEFHQVEDADLSNLHESSLSQISDSALGTVNLFLDRILHNVLASSRSLSLANLRTAVKEVLKPRLAAEAIGGADEELIECIGEDDEVDLFEDATETMDGPFDLMLIWKRARLRCMVYTRLGDMEEDDEERFIDEQSLNGYTDGRRMSRNNGLVSPPVAIWLTAILEFIGEHALMISSHSAYRRAETKYGRGLAGQRLHPSVVTISDGDLEKIALNPTLGRLWRAWRKPLKSPRASISRALSSDSLRHRRVDSKSSLGYGRWPSVETLSRRSPVEQAEREYRDGPSETLRNDSLAEEPEPAEADDAELSRASELTPADIPLPISEHDIDEIEVPGYDPELDFEGRFEDSAWTSKRPTSMAFYHSSDPSGHSETPLLRGPRHMRSQSLPSERRPSAFAQSNGDHPNVAGVLEAAHQSDRPVSHVSNGEVFNSLKNPTDYQTPDSHTPGRDGERRTLVASSERKSILSEYGGDGPVLFDRSDYRVDADERPAMTTTTITAATPTEMPSTPVSIPKRSGLRSNRPVSLAINSPNKLAAPARALGDVSPVDETDQLQLGEVSPLEPSDDEGSLSIPGLQDAKEHMGLEPTSGSLNDSTTTYDDAVEEQAVSPLSPRAPSYALPLSPPESVTALPSARREVGDVGSRPQQDYLMVRQVSDDRKREAVVMSGRSSRDSQGSRKSDLPDIPKREQVSKLVAAAKAHGNVAVPQPERIYNSMSKDYTGRASPKSLTPTAPAPTTARSVNVPVEPSPGPSPQPSPVSTIETATTITRIYRNPTPKESPRAVPEPINRESSPMTNLPSVTPLQLQPNSVSDAATDPPASKLLERRKQLPHVETVSSDRMNVQRLTASPHSSDGETQQLARRIERDEYSVTALPMPRDSPTSTETRRTLSRPGSRPGSRGTSRPGSRKAMKTADEPFGHKVSKSRSSSIERLREFEQLIDSGQTIQYTLTPQTIRSYQSGEATPEPVPAQTTTNSRTRGLSLTGGFSTKSRSNTQTAPGPPVVAAPPQSPTAPNLTAKVSFAGIPVRRPPGATPSIGPGLSKKPGLAPREAKSDMSSMRDFADFMRNTGPSETSGKNSSPPQQKVVRGPKPASVAIQPKPQSAGMPIGLLTPTTPVSPVVRPPGTARSDSRRGPRLMARDPQTTDKSASDLIDFIREGPPGENGIHKSPRTVTPFRSTGDSEDMRNGGGSTSNGYGRYSNSVNSTQESIKTSSQISSMNSHTALLASARSSAGNGMSGVEEEPQGMMPTRKSRKPRDPYAIDFSDDEDFEEDERADTPNTAKPARGHKREESLVEFLQSQLPSDHVPTIGKTVGSGISNGVSNGTGPRVSSLGRPIGSGPGMARPKPQGRPPGVNAGVFKSDSADLADFFKNSAPPAATVTRQVSIQGMAKERKGAFGGIFKRNRG